MKVETLVQDFNLPRATAEEISGIMSEEEEVLPVSFNMRRRIEAIMATRLLLVTIDKGYDRPVVWLYHIDLLNEVNSVSFTVQSPHPEIALRGLIRQLIAIKGPGQLDFSEQNTKMVL